MAAIRSCLERCFSRRQSPLCHLESSSCGIGGRSGFTGTAASLVELGGEELIGIDPLGHSRFCGTHSGLSEADRAGALSHEALCFFYFGPRCGMGGGRRPKRCLRIFSANACFGLDEIRIRRDDLAFFGFDRCSVDHQPLEIFSDSGGFGLKVRNHVDISVGIEGDEHGTVAFHEERDGATRSGSESLNGGQETGEIFFSSR